MKTREIGKFLSKIFRGAGEGICEADYVWGVVESRVVFVFEEEGKT